MKAYAQKRREDLAAYQKRYKEENRDRLTQAAQEYFQRTKAAKAEVRRENGRRWRIQNPELKRKLAREWSSLKRATDPRFSAEKSLRDCVYYAFKRRSTRKLSTTEQLLGCSIPFAREYLEAKFKPGMSWSNHGLWHIDHIVPCASAKTHEELVALQHYTNLQPLWAVENIRKGSKV